MNLNFNNLFKRIGLLFCKRKLVVGDRVLIKNLKEEGVVHRVNDKTYIIRHKTYHSSYYRDNLKYIK
jgi:putative ribosome biogenesis GTPase RsgA